VNDGPDFERFRRAVFCMEPDRVPLAELEVDRLVAGAFIGRPIKALEDEIEFWKEAGYDYFILNPLNVVADLFENQPTSMTDSCYGPSTVERKWTFEHQGLITSRDDLAKLPADKARPEDYEPVCRALKILPSGMGLIIHLGGFFEYAWQLMGFERFSIALVDEPELVDSLWNWVNRALMNHFEAVMDFRGISGIWLCDDLAYTEGLLVSPDLLRRYVFPSHRKIGRVCRDRGIPLIYHSDGDLTQVMDDIIENGVNALHPIEPKALDIYEMKKRYSGRLALVGNIDLSYTLTRASPEEVREDVRKHIRGLAPGGGYLLGSSNSIPDYVPIENYKAMVSAALEFGRYPIVA